MTDPTLLMIATILGDVGINIGAAALYDLLKTGIQQQWNVPTFVKKLSEMISRPDADELARKVIDRLFADGVLVQKRPAAVVIEGGGDNTFENCYLQGGVSMKDTNGNSFHGTTITN